MSSPFLFPCIAAVALGFAGGTGQGRAASAKFDALTIAKNDTEQPVAASAPKLAGCVRNCPVERVVEEEAGSSALTAEAARSRRERADERSGLFLFLLQVLRSPK